MKLKLSKESSLHSSDYFELLNSIDIKSNISDKSKKGITRTQDGIILNPNFINPDFEKVQKENTYIKCCSIRFLHNNAVFIVNGTTHTGSLNNAKQLVDTVINEFERGFTLSDNTFISCEEAPSFIKNYKFFNPELALKVEQYFFIKDGNKVKMEKANKIILEGTIIKEKIKKDANVYLMNVGYYCFENISKTLVCSIQHKKRVMYLYELTRFFKFSKRKKAKFNIEQN